MSRRLGLNLKRDIKRTFNKRTISIWTCMAAICVFLFFTSDGALKLEENGTVQFITVMLAQIMFGAWAVLSVYFDIISADREHNVLDMILCSGVSKGTVFLSRMLTMMIVSLILSMIYLFPITAVIVGISGQPGYFSLFIQYMIPLWGYIMVYASLGLVISVTARSSKSAVIWSLAGGLILMPRFFMIIVEGLGTAFHWTDSIINAVSMISPSVLMYALSDFADTARLMQAVVGLLIGITVLLLLSFFVFTKQDELNYGE